LQKIKTMKLSKKTIKKILSDDVLIFAHRRNLWKNGITPKFNISDEVLEFLQFLESHNHLLDFIKLHDNYSETIVNDVYGIMESRKNEGTIQEYFINRPKKFYLKGAYRWYLRDDRKELWNGLNELWNEKIK